MTDHTLRLRAVEPEDVDFMLECEEDRESAKWSDYTAPFSRHQLIVYAETYDADPFAAGQLRLIIEDESRNRIGIADLFGISQRDSKAYAGICIHPSYRGKGWSETALKALIDFCRDRLGLTKLVAEVATVNHRAAAVFRKCHFTELCILPAWHKIGQTYFDFHLFTLDL